jgi:hypothetical protein
MKGFLISPTLPTLSRHFGVSLSPDVPGPSALSEVQS